MPIIFVTGDGDIPMGVQAMKAGAVEFLTKPCRCLRADGTLAGAALDMASAVRNCVTLLQISLPDALRYASRNPAEFIGVGHILGRLAPGYRADMVAINPNPFAVLGTWVAGKHQSSPGFTPP